MIIEFYLNIIQADQICYAVLCVFSYVAAGSGKKLQSNILSTPSSTVVTPQPTVTISQSPTPVQLSQQTTRIVPPPQHPLPIKTPEEIQTLTAPIPTPETGTVTPIGGPPTYPPPALPPNVQPPAPPPGRHIVQQHSLSRPLKPPPVPSRNVSSSSGSSSPQPPPRNLK